MFKRLVPLLAPVMLIAAACAQVVPPATTGSGTATATCANTEEDAAAVNDAIADSSEGAEIVIFGICLLNEPLRLLGGRNYRGASRTGTVLRQADGANMPVLVASASYFDNDPGTGQPLTIRDLTLDGNRDNNEAATDGLVLRSWQSVAEDLRIFDFGGSGIRITNVSSDGTTLTSTQVNGLIADSFIGNSGKHGIHVEDTGNAVTDWQLTGNWVADSGLDGINMDNATGWIVTHNHVYGVGNNAIWAQRMYGTTITDNYVEGFGESSTEGTWYGIGGTVQGDAGSTIGMNRVFTLRGENPGSTYRYIGLVGVNYGEAVVAVTGNVVRGVGSPGSVGLFYSTEAGRGLTVSSSGNAVAAVATPVEVEGDGVAVTSSE